MTIQILDLFSGCGGLSWGFHNRPDHFDIIGSIDFDIHANKTYELNYGITPKKLDIANLSADILKSEFCINNKKPLMIIGGPPCQGFSSHKKKDKRDDSRNSLVAKYAELCVECKADIVIIENVPDLFTEKHWHHFEAAKKIFSNNGYKVQAKIINMAEFGVPQERFRAVVLVTKKKYNIPFPQTIFERGSFKTVRNAIGSLPELKAGEKCKNDPMHITSKHKESTIEIFKAVPKDGGSRPLGVGPKCLDKVKGFSDVYGRLYWDRPSVTITARCRTPSCGKFLHPEQDRGLSVREAALLQGFPPGFIFEGPFDDKYKQIGNAVPPKFSEVLANTICSEINNQNYNINNPDLTINVTKPIGKSFSTLISFIKQGRKIEEFLS